MSASREDIDDVIATILDSAPPSLAGLSLSASSTSSSTSLRNTNTTLELSTLPVLPPPIDSTLILIRAAKGPLDPASQPTNEDESAPFILHARTGKQGYHAFFDSIEAPVHRSEVALREGKRVDVRVEVCDPQGEANDLGLAFLVVLFGAFSLWRLLVLC